MKLKIVMVDFELSRRQRRLLAALAVPLLIGAGAVAYADVPTAWKDGDMLTANALNDNFADVDMRLGALDAANGAAATELAGLDAKVTKLEAQVFAKDGNNGSQSCDAWCVQTAMGSPSAAGTCVGAFENGGDYRSCGAANVVALGVFCYCSRFGP